MSTTDLADQQTGRSAGRPRDPRIDEQVLRATRELLAEVGFSATTIQAVARRAGVGAPAIYRRWSDRIQLIESAITPTLEAAPVVHSGDLRSDVQRYIDIYTEMFSAPAAVVAVPGLLSAYQSSPAAHRSVSLRIGGTVRADFCALIRSATPASVDPGVDPEDLLDQLIGSVLYRVFMRPFTGREERPDATADVLLRAMRPASVEPHP